MPSTYSPLKVELIGDGDQSGTWGATTNTNLGTALEEAIVNTASVTFASADVTLTLVDSNVTQTARNMRLNLIGVSGGARNLIVPAIQKNYLVVNTLADTVTIKNSTGTGIAIPSGDTAFVYNNGTNVLQAFDFLPTLKTNTLNVVNALGATSGGTGLTSFSTNGALYATSSTALTSGTLPTASGGTGSTATPTAGAIAYGTGTGYAFTVAGTAGQTLTSNGAGEPFWSSGGGGGGISTGKSIAMAMIFGF
jgi:hypothetical protein